MIDDEDIVGENLTSAEERAEEERQFATPTDKFELLPKHEVVGDFVASQAKSSVKGPWGLFERTPPFATYIDRIFRPRKVYYDEQRAQYTGKLLDCKAENDFVVFDYARVIMEEMREGYWRRKVRKKWETARQWMREFRSKHWPEFRRRVGF